MKGVQKSELQIEAELKKLQKKEDKLIKKRQEKKDSLLNRKLAETVPNDLQERIDKAFLIAFQLIFEKGTQFIGALSKKENSSPVQNVLISGAAGIGMGVAGVGLPDIPIFSAMMLKSIYEIAQSYGYKYDTKEEQYFILMMIEGAVSYGSMMKFVDKKINTFIEKGKVVNEDVRKSQMKRTASALSKELLYMKFLQGVPVVGIIGGAYDAIYMKKITEYAELKYRKRYLKGLVC